MPDSYSIRLTKVPATDSEPECWLADVPEFPEISGERSSNPAQAVEALHKTLGFLSNAGLLERPRARHADNAQPTSPTAARNESGHLHLRIPRDLRDRLLAQSHVQGVSLNQYAGYLLTRAAESISDK